MEKNTSSFKTFRYLVLVFFILVLIVLVEGFLYFNFKKKKEGIKKQPSQQTIESKQLANREIASKVLNCLENLKDREKEVYYSGKFCSTEADCAPLFADLISGVAAIWGRFKYFQETKDAQQMGIIDQELESHSNRSIARTIQGSSWNCKLMYELWQSDLFSENQKEKIKKICLINYYPEILDWAEEIISSGKNASLNKELELTKIIEEGRTALLPFMPESQLGEEAKLAALSRATSDFVAKFLWDKNPQNEELAKLFFNESIRLYFGKPETFARGEEGCLLGVAALDIYKIFPEKSYLDLAEFLYRQEKTKVKETDLPANVACLFLNQELIQGTNSSEYKKEKELIIKGLTNKRFDFTGYPANFSQSGCFFISPKPNLALTVKENAILVGLLLAE